MNGRSVEDEQLPVLNIVGERVALGPLRKDLLPLYQRWINDLGTSRNLGATPRPMTLKQEQTWYEEWSKSETQHPFTIYERPGLRPIGSTALHEVDFRSRSATFGILIGEAEYRGKSYGTEATRLMLDYAFTALGLHNVMLTVFDYNPAGFRAYEKAGFREFGRRHECRWMGGRLWDEIYMEALSAQFESPALARIFGPDEPR